LLGARVSNVTQVPSEHCFPTTDFGNACWWKGSPYINNCDYDGAGAMLRALYGPSLRNGSAVAGNLIQFDQTPFGGGANSIATSGFLYVPSACQPSSSQLCKLHVQVHGCQQGVDTIGNDYAANTGVNDWAEANDIIVLYPNFVANDLTNPEGCADWWGYTNGDYAFKNGLQMQFVHALTDALKSSR
jgi:hypothetical protein